MAQPFRFTFRLCGFAPLWLNSVFSGSMVLRSFLPALRCSMFVFSVRKALFSRTTAQSHASTCRHNSISRTEQHWHSVHEFGNLHASQENRAIEAVPLRTADV